MRDAQIPFDGEVYSVAVTNRFLRRVEREISISKIFVDIGSGAPRVPDCAFLIAELLKEAGADVNEDQVFVYLMNDFSNNDGKEFTEIMQSFGEAISPPASEGDTGEKKHKGRKARK